MKFMLSRKGARSNLETLLTHEEINNYYKISSCCDQLKSVFEKYAGVKFTNYYDYLAKSMSRQAFLAFLIQEQHESREYV